MKRFTSSARRASLPAPPVAGHTAASAILPPARNAATWNSAPAWPTSSRRRKADPQATGLHRLDPAAELGNCLEVGLFGILRGKRKQREHKIPWGIWNAWSLSPHRNVAQALRFAGSAVILPGSTVATRPPHPTEVMLSRRAAAL